MSDQANQEAEAPARPAASGGLSVSATVQRGDFELELDLQIPPGTSVGLSGGIGAGKTTALLLLAGWLRSSTGGIVHDGVVWDNAPSKTFVYQRPAAMMSQRFLQDLPEHLSGDALITQALLKAASVKAASGSRSPADPSAARDLLSGLGVGPQVSERLPWTWSGAEAQRVALARAIALRPRLLLLDEPFTALDKATGASVRSWLAQILSGYTGITVIASTRTDHLEPLTDEIVMLDA